MRNLIILCLNSLFFAGLACIGLVCLIAPRKVIRFQEWLSGMDAWPRADGAPRPKSMLPLRIAGLAMALMGGVVVAKNARGFRELTLSDIMAKLPTSESVSSNWLPLVLAGVVFFLGVYTLARPKVVVRVAAKWMARQISNRVITEDHVEESVPMARLSEGFMLFLGIMALLAWLNGS